MYLISCDNCGVVLDKSKLVFPLGRTEWNGVDYVPATDCPVCQETILDEE